MKTEKFSGIALAILALLYEEPMHPYRMQQLIKERGKDEVINVSQRASLYQTINRLLRVKLIAIRETERDEKRPERTIYELTEKGRETLLTWMREILSKPTREFPNFPVALAYLPLLSPEDARSQLEDRASALATEMERLDTELRHGIEIVPRLFLVETEYLRNIVYTELQWVQSLIADLRSEQLTWTDEWMRGFAANSSLDQQE